MSCVATLGSLFLSQPSLVNNFVEKAEIINTPKGAEIQTIASVDDIEIFEKQNNCSFGFVQKWDDKKVYNVRKFLEVNKNNPDNKRNRFEKISYKFANKFKNKCKKRKAIALFFHKNKFDLNEEVFK